MIELAPGHKHGLVLANPVMNAAGVLGLGSEYRGLVPLARLGAFVTNPVTLNPRTPAHPPNVVVTEQGLVIHTGLPGPGVREVVRRHNREWRHLGAPVIFHLAATTPPEVERAVTRLEAADGLSGIELGLRDDASATEVQRLVEAARGGPPLLVRLPVARAAHLAPAAARAGADALTVGGAPRQAAPAQAHLPGQPQDKLHRVTGRLYGPGCFEQAYAAVSAVAALGLGLPLVGAGGIFALDQARQMLAAGAVAIQVDAAVWGNPRFVAELIDGLSASTASAPASAAPGPSG